MLGQCPSLSELDLRDNRIQSRGARSIACVLGQCRSLTSLNLYGNDIDELDVKMLQGCVERLNTSWRRFGIHGIWEGELCQEDDGNRDW